MLNLPVTSGRSKRPPSYIHVGYNTHNIVCNSIIQCAVIETETVQHQTEVIRSNSQGKDDYGAGYFNLNKCILNWLLKLEMVCWDLVLSASLFHLVSTALAKQHLPIAFVG